MAEKRLRVCVYYRYSTDKKAQTQNSETRQKSELLEECVKRDWRVVWIDGDKATSGDSTKPKLEELKEQVATKEILADALFISSWDRLTRKDSLDYSDDVRWLRDAGMKLAIKDKGSTLNDLSDNQQLLLFQMEVYAANQYLKDLSSKVISGQTSRFKQGTLGYTRVPFGFDKVPATDNASSGIVPNDDFSLVADIFQQAVNQNVQSCVEILRDSKTYRQRDSTPTANVVKAILRNPVYISKRTFGVAGVGKHGTVKGTKTNTKHNVNRLKNAAHVVDISDEVPAAISEDLFFQAQEMLDSNTSRWESGTRKNNQKKKYRFAGLLRCSHCRAKLIAEKKTRHVNYVCPQSKSSRLRCSGGRKTIRESAVETLLKAWASKIWFSEEFHWQNFNHAVKAYRRYRRQKDGVKDSELAVLEGKERNLDDLITAVSTGGVNDIIIQKIQTLQDEIDTEKEKLTKDSSADVQWFEELVGEKSDAVAAKLNAATDDTTILKLWAKFIFALASECVDELEHAEEGVVKLDARNFFNLNFRSYSFKRLLEKKTPDLLSLADEGVCSFKFDGSRNQLDTISFTQRGVFGSSDNRGHSLDTDSSCIGTERRGCRSPRLSNATRPSGTRSSRPATARSTRHRARAARDRRHAAPSQTGSAD